VNILYLLQAIHRYIPTISKKVPIDCRGDVHIQINKKKIENLRPQKKYNNSKLRLCERRGGVLRVPGVKCVGYNIFV